MIISYLVYSGDSLLRYDDIGQCLKVSYPMCEPYRQFGADVVGALRAESYWQ